MKKIEKVLNCLEHVQGGNNQWTARCPVHDDQRNSLSIKLDERNGNILLYCFAGCSYHDIDTRIKQLIRGEGQKYE